MLLTYTCVYTVYTHVYADINTKDYKGLLVFIWDYKRLLKITRLRTCRLQGITSVYLRLQEITKNY